jgi:DNA mismatch repair protein MutS2
LPVVDALVAVVGDEQDLMLDRSTFSGRLLRLKEAWGAAGRRSIVLLDELGSGTDPQEGAALALALLERLAAEGSIALVTTHLLELASAALDLDGAACAAMEFDRRTGRPTYRLLPGPPGASEAIALARQLELPAEWLERATALVGPEHRSLSQMLAEVETLRGEIENEAIDLATARRTVERERQAAAEERDALVAERLEVDGRQKRELEAFRRQVRDRLEAEIETLREALTSGRRRGLAGEAVERLFAEAPEPLVEPEPGAPITLGDRVRHRDYAWEGVVERLDGDSAEITVHGKRLRCGLDSLMAVTTAEVPSSKGVVRVEHEDRDVARELKLVGRRVEESLDEIDGYLDRAVLAGLPEVRLIHGHGSGRLRQGIREFLAGHPSVDNFRSGARREGGDGATVVTLRL